MWPPTLTDCECTSPGWCERHRCLKTAHFHRLCRRNETYFQLYERGEGPCLPSPDDVIVPAESGDGDGEEPGLLRKAFNFGKAVVKHVADGCERVDDATYAQRIAVCKDCPSCDLERLVCKEQGCGCCLETKARWRSEDCPRGNWPALDAKREAASASHESQP